VSSRIRYEAPWLVYGMNWSVREDKKFRLAIGSFVEEYNNKVEIVELDEEAGKFECTGSFDHPYPTTKIVWMPDRPGSRLSVPTNFNTMEVNFHLISPVCVQARPPCNHRRLLTSLEGWQRQGFNGMPAE